MNISENGSILCIVNHNELNIAGECSYTFYEDGTFSWTPDNWFSGGRKRL